MGVHENLELRRITAPQSFTSLPLTPPPSDRKPTASVILRITEEIRNRKVGHNFSSEPWNEFEVNTKEYEELERLFQYDGWVQDKLRYGLQHLNNLGFFKFTYVEAQIRLLPTYQAGHTSEAFCIA